MQTIKVKERKENLERIQDEFNQFIIELERLRPEAGTIRSHQNALALNIVIRGATKEMNNYVRKYLNEDNTKMKVPTI